MRRRLKRRNRKMNSIPYFKITNIVIQLLLDGNWETIMDDLKGELEFFIEFIISNKINVHEKNIVTIWERYNKEFRITERFPSNKLKEQVFKKYGYQCQKCGRREGLTIDHIIPFAKFGQTILENLTVLCISCNQKKGAKI
jgi:HNH endonuclease